MADAIYPLYKQSCLAGDTNTSLSTGNVKAALVDTASYTYDTAHQFYTSISAAVQANSPNLTGKSVTNGQFSCADYQFVSASGNQSEAIVYYIDTGVAGTSRLVCYKDSLADLPVTPNGGNINITAGNVFSL